MLVLDFFTSQRINICIIKQSIIQSTFHLPQLLRFLTSSLILCSTGGAFSVISVEVPIEAIEAIDAPIEAPIGAPIEAPIEAPTFAGEGPIFSKWNCFSRATNRDFAELQTKVFLLII